MDKWRLVAVMMILAVAVSGCIVPRSNNGSGDIEQAFVPPPSEAAAQEGGEAAAPANEGGQAAAQQAGQAVLRLEPTSQQLNVGDTATVELRIDDVTELVGVDITVQFDPALLEVVDAKPDTEGIQVTPGNFPQPDLIVRNLVDQGSGEIHYVSLEFNASAQGSDFVPPQASGSGLVAAITFRGLAEGTGSLIISRAELANVEAELIPVTLQNGQVVVGQGGGEPTATHTPTPTATTPAGPSPTPTNTAMPGADTPTPTTVPPTNTPAPTATFTPVPPPSPTPTSLPLAENVPPGATVGFCYRVQPGDTLYAIQQKFGVDAQAINLVNDLYPANYIFPYQGLFIPTQMGHGPNVYIVQPGDTLASIAEDCHLPLDFLAWSNDIPEGGILEAGQVLLIRRPPFAPPSRYPYPPHVHPPYCYPGPC